jgi:hypothetical protein
MQKLGEWKRWAIGLVLVGTAILAVTPVVDQQAEANYQSLFQRALVTFALARTLNGVISTVQGTELALQPAGVGLTLTPGEILDPVNDLVERFSWIMLGASVSLGIQDVLLDISGWWVIQALVALLALCLLAVTIRSGASGQGVHGILTRVFLIALFIRFAVPVTLIANDVLYTLFLEPRYTESREVMAATGEVLEKIGSEEGGMSAENGGSSNGSVFDTISRAVDSATQTLDLRTRVQQVKQQAARAIEHIIQLSVVFILQTGVLPIAFLWVFLQSARWVFRPSKS